MGERTKYRVRYLAFRVNVAIRKTVTRMADEFDDFVKLQRL
jgi:hypothetical protein